MYMYIKRKFVAVVENTADKVAYSYQEMTATTNTTTTRLRDAEVISTADRYRYTSDIRFRFVRFRV